MSQANNPPWWNTMGSFVYQTNLSDVTTLTFTSKSAHLKISRRPKHKKTFGVRWIIYTKTGKVDGYRIFTAQELCTAFACCAGDLTPSGNPSYATDHDAEFGVPDIFIRDGEFLNIPGPASDAFDRTKISIKVTDAISHAVKLLITNG